MIHSEMLLLVSSYVDGEVTDGEAKKVLAHLEVCPDCRRFRGTAMQVRGEIRSQNDILITPVFAEKVMHGVQKRDRQSVEWLGIEPLARRTVWAIAVVVLLLFALTSFRNGSNAGIAEQYFNGISSDSTGVQVLLQQEAISKNDLLYAVMTK